MIERVVTGKVATIGVDVGGTSISGGLVTHDGEVLLTVETPTHVAGLGTALKTLLALIHDVYSQARARDFTVDGIGLGVPGPVDVDKGMMSASASTLRNHVPEFYGVPIAEQIQALTELPTFIDNDVNALALGERAFGLGRCCGGETSRRPDRTTRPAPRSRPERTARRRPARRRSPAAHRAAG
jgi:glucokinase